VTAAAVAARLAAPLRTNVSLRLGVALLACLVVFSVVGSLALVDPLDQDLDAAYAAPGSLDHPLGGDALGRDILSWCARAILTALAVSLGVVALSALFGVVIGLLAGYAGGVVDAALMRLVDLQLAIPPLLLFIAASAVVATEMWSLIVLLAVVGWVPYARLVRAQVLAVSRRS
jgi:peptide/nickel transport system permease protein